jgi:hypothetical protein
MNSLYQRVLNNELSSGKRSDRAVGLTVTITNSLLISVSVYQILEGPRHKPLADKTGAQIVRIEAGGEKTGLTLKPGFYVVKSSLSGGFVCVFEVASTGNQKITIDFNTLCVPNDIGDLPKPRIAEKHFIPADSTRILVGCGHFNGPPARKFVITREQYWKLSPDSFTLSPGEESTVSLTTTTGKQEISSSEETISKDLGVSLSAGWGAFSASISASLSTTSTTFQQVTVTNESVQYQSSVRKNTTGKVQMYLKWALTDVITIYEIIQTVGNPVVARASITSTQSPTLIGGPYDLPSPTSSSQKGRSKKG